MRGGGIQGLLELFRKVICFSNGRLPLELTGLWLIEEQIGAICCDGNAAALPRRRKKDICREDSLEKEQKLKISHSKLLN